MILYGVLICKIVRYMTKQCLGFHDLSYTFPKESVLISIVLDFWQNQPAQVQKFELNPEAPIKVSVLPT
jgi:hypothetical protein